MDYITKSVNGVKVEKYYDCICFNANFINTFFNLRKKTKKRWIKIICCIMAIMPFFIVSAFRYDLGTDYTRRYVFDYNRTLQGIDVPNLEILFKSNYEVLYYIYRRTIFNVCHNICNYCWIYSRTSFKKSQDKILSVCIFLLGGFFFDSLNIMRQYMAMSLVFFGYQFFIKKQKMVFDIYSYSYNSNINT